MDSPAKKRPVLTSSPTRQETNMEYLATDVKFWIQNLGTIVLDVVATQK